MTLPANTVFLDRVYQMTLREWVCKASRRMKVMPDRVLIQFDPSEQLLEHLYNKYDIPVYFTRNMF